MGVMNARYPGTCTACGQPFAAGEQINHYEKGKATHVNCMVSMFLFSTQDGKQSFGQQHCPSDAEALAIGLGLSTQHRTTVVVSRVIEGRAIPMGLVKAPPESAPVAPPAPVPAVEAPLIQWADGADPF